MYYVFDVLFSFSSWHVQMFLLFLIPFSFRKSMCNTFGLLLDWFRFGSICLGLSWIVSICIGLYRSVSVCIMVCLGLSVARRGFRELQMSSEHSFDCIFGNAHLPSLTNSVRGCNNADCVVGSFNLTCQPPMNSRGQDCNCSDCVARGWSLARDPVVFSRSHGCSHGSCVRWLELGASASDDC